MDHDEIVRLTREYGGEWAINHALRLLDLIQTIAEDRTYHAEAVWLAAYLHDWGGYPPWLKAEADHAVRSREVAGEFLTARGCPDDLKRLVLECIEHHHSGEPDRSLESILLSDADAIDFLGVTGVLRSFSMVGRDLRKAAALAKQRRDISNEVVLLPKARELAAQLTSETDRVLRALETETRGHF